MNSDYSSDSTIKGGGTSISVEEHRAELRALDDRRWEEMQTQRKAHEESVDQLRARHGRELTERNRLLAAANQRLSASEHELKQATIAAKQRAADLALQTSFRINELEASAASARRERDLSRSNLNDEIRKGLKSNSDLHAKLSKANASIDALEEDNRLLCEAYDEAAEQLRALESERSSVTKSAEGVLRYCEALEKEKAEAQEAAKQLVEDAGSRERGARRELLEALSPIFDIVRYASAESNLSLVRRQLDMAFVRFEELGIRVGRDPETVLSATACSRMIGVPKPRLRKIPVDQLWYEVFGAGKQREHRVYRVRDCVRYLTLFGPPESAALRDMK